MAHLTDTGRSPRHYRESPGAKEVLPACCLVFGTTPGAEQVFRAEKDLEAMGTARSQSGQQCGDWR